jgi:hypothetical protein
MKTKLRDLEMIKSAIDISLRDCREDRDQQDIRPIKDLEEQLLSLVPVTTPRGDTQSPSSTPEKQFTINLTRVARSPNKLYDTPQQCYSCHLRSYYIDRVFAADRYFHTYCFKCSICGLELQLSTFKGGYKDGEFELYCQKHYKENTIQY